MINRLQCPSWVKDCSRCSGVFFWLRVSIMCSVYAVSMVLIVSSLLWPCWLTCCYSTPTFKQLNATDNESATTHLIVENRHSSSLGLWFYGNEKGVRFIPFLMEHMTDEELFSGDESIKETVHLIREISNYCHVNALDYSYVIVRIFTLAVFLLFLLGLGGRVYYVLRLKYRKSTAANFQLHATLANILVSLDLILLIFLIIITFTFTHAFIVQNADTQWSDLLPGLASSDEGFCPRSQLGFCGSLNIMGGALFVGECILLQRLSSNLERTAITMRKEERRRNRVIISQPPS